MKNRSKFMQKWSTQICFALVAIFLLGSCDIASDIRQVGSNYTPKSQFEGEWYYRPIIVDKQYNNNSIFIGSQCDIDRVKFEITEDVLRIYRSYEKVPGTEGANAGKQTLVAAFPIKKHFDIRREYNPVNGVENNIIIENDFDRPWWERENIRVDWSNNLVTDTECNDWIQTHTVLQIPRDSSNHVREPYKVRISDDYMETTVEALARPQESTCNYIGDWNCDGAQVKMKFSFSKIKENDYEKLQYPDYLPLEYGQTKNKKICSKGEEGCEGLKELWLNYSSSGAQICDPTRHNLDDCKQYEIPVFSRFGYFRTERYFYDRENDFTLSGRQQYINRWNLWQQTKNADGSLIPISERTPKPVVYYLNVQYPMDLYDASQKIASEWNIAFSDTVAQLKSSCTLKGYHVYVDTHGLNQEMKKFGFKVVTEGNLQEACEKLGEFSIEKALKPLFFSGDYKQINHLYGPLFQIRTNYCNLANVNNYVEEHNLAKDLSSFGIGSVTEGNLEEACAVLESVSARKKLKTPFYWQQLGDLRYSFFNVSSKAELAGPLGYGPSSADPLTGEIINANANIYGASLDVYAAWGADVVQYLNSKTSEEEVLNASFTRNQMKDALEFNYLRQVSKDEISRFENLFDRRTAQLSDREYLVQVPLASLGENWNTLKKNGFEEQYLITDEMLKLFSGNPNKEYSKQLLESTLPSSWSKAFLPSIESIVGNHSSKKSTYSAIAAFNHKIDFFGRHNACFLAEAVEPAIADLAVKLKGKSWEEAYQFIRANVLIAVGLHELGHTFGLRHNFEGSMDAMNFFPEYWNVKTADHRHSNFTKHKSEMRYSSIMDYHQRFNSDFAGLGLYDKAAIKFGYGNLVEVFDEQWGNFVPRDWHGNVDMFHYKDLPYLFSGDEVDEKLNAHYSEVQNQYKAGNKDARIDVKSLGIKPQPENLYRRKNVDFGEYYKTIIHRLLWTPSTEKAIFYEVPYRYCSDAYASGESLTCNRWDMGASVEEIVDNAAQMYEAYYLFDSFRRDKINFSAANYMARLYNRIYQPMLAPFKQYYFYHRTSMQIWPQMEDLAKASIKGLNFFGRVLQTVEPGAYCLNAQNVYVPEKDALACENKINIGLDQGRYYDTHFTQNFFFKPDNIGHMYDKLLALQALTDSASLETRDFAVTMSRDAYSIGYYRVFAPELIKLFSGLLKEDVLSYSPNIILDGENKPVIQYKPIVDFGTFQTMNTAPSIKASNSWIMRYYALVFPMVNYTSNVDKQLDFAKRARITLVGSNHDPIVDSSIKQIVFVDPITKVQYRSLAPEGEALAPGYQLLKEAQSLVSDGSNGEATGAWYQAKLDLENAKQQQNAAATSGNEDALKQASEAQQKALINMKAMDNKLYQQVQIIDFVRYLGDLFDYGG